MKIILLFIFWTILKLISARRNAEIQKKLDNFLENLIHEHENSSIKQPGMIMNLPDDLVDILAQTQKHGEDAQREIRDGANHLSLPYISIRGRIMTTPNGNIMINFLKDEYTNFLTGIDLNLQTIKAAELKVHWKPISNPSIKRSKIQFQMTVYDVINKLKNQKKAMDVKTVDDILDVCPTPTKIFQESRSYETSSTTTLDRNWYTFDVSSAVFRWEKMMMKKKPIKHELMLQKSSIKIKLPSPPNHKSKDSSELVPTSKTCEVIPKGNVTEVKLLVYIKVEDSISKHPISKREAKRHRGRKNKGNKNDYCHLEKRWVDFDDINWSGFILSPPGYEMNVCAGKCGEMYPIPDHYNTTNHAVLQSLYNSMGAEANGLRIPPPCCIPIEFGDLSMLTLTPKDLLNEEQLKIFGPYVDDVPGTIKMGIYPNMTVTSCGCR